MSWLAKKRMKYKNNKMKIKVNLFDKTLFKNYLALLTKLTVLITYAFIIIEIPIKYKVPVGICLALLLLIIYIIMWLIANFQDKATLNINNSIMITKTGDIFEEDGLKVIAFNEYFDTLVDNMIIAERSLNGIYIKSKINDIEELNRQMSNNTHLSENIIAINPNRLYGKKTKYKLGTIYQQDDYLLTAFAKFDDDNRAYLSMNDFVNFLLNFWNEIDKIYGGRSISIPLLGSGITRLKEYNAISEQELLELLIWSFKISRIKFTYPSIVSIIIDKSKKDKINFYKLNKE